MRLLYINPPKNPKIRYKENIIPLSLLYLSAVTRKLCETEILDLKIENQVDPFSRIDEKIHNYKPDVVGITCLFSGDITNVLKIATRIKQWNPLTMVMIGGMHPTLFAEEIIKHCLDIDIVIIGEGEDTTEKILRAISENRDFSGIQGVVYRKQNDMPLLTAYGSDKKLMESIQKSSVCHVPKLEYIQEVDRLPMPAYDLFQFKDYICDTSRWYNPNHIPINGMSVPILTSRSCPTCCNFCSMNQVMGLHYRARSASSVIYEMDVLYNQYGVRYFNIMDDNFTLDKRRTIQICDAIVSKNMKIAIECSSGLFVNSLDDEVIDALVSAGLIMTAVAIESGSDYIRNEIIGKHLRREKIYEVVSSFRRHPQVYLYGFFVIGFPEDTEETIDDTIHMIEELELDDISVNPVVPLPGTRLFEQCKKEKLFTQEMDYQNLWREEGLFCTPYLKRFYIKPVALSLQQLEEYYMKFVQLKQKKRAISKASGKSLNSYE